MERFVNKYLPNIQNVNFKEKLDGDGNKLDGVRIEVARNWGNCIYTSRKGGNLIYLALKNKEIVASKYRGDSFKVIAQMTELLKKNNIEYRIDCN